MSKSRRAGRLVAEVRKLPSHLYKPGILLGRSSHHVPRHPTRRPNSPLAQHLLFLVRLAAPVFDQPPERLPQAFIAPLFFGATLAVIGWIPFFQWTYVNSQPDMLADFVSAEYRKAVSARMLIVPVATTLTAVFCFLERGDQMAIYLLLLPLYMLPGKLGGAKPEVWR